MKKNIMGWYPGGTKVKVRTVLGEFETIICQPCSGGGTTWYKVDFSPIILGAPKHFDKKFGQAWFDVEEKFITPVENEE